MRLLIPYETLKRSTDGFSEDELSSKSTLCHLKELELLM